MNTTRPTDAEDMVELAFACPKCGERSMEMLAWEPDGDTIECQECGYVYDPSAAPDADEIAADREASDLLDVATDMRERHAAGNEHWAGLRPLGATRMFEWEADRAENEAHDRR